MTEKIPPARPAAIVLLLRDGANGLEVLCLQRSRRLGAFSGMLSFPGGKVAGADADPALRDRCDGAGRLDEKTFAFAVAAVREAFEECGLLFARRAGQTEPIGDAWALSHARDRARLAEGSLTMAAFARAHDLRLSLDWLTLFAHWITPEVESHRFDTLFFAARAPDGHAPSHDGGEIVEGLWITPDDALAEAAAGRRSIVFPTRLTLMRLSAYGSAGAAIAGVGDWTVEPIMPVLRETAGEKRLTIPAETGYPVTELPLDIAAGRVPWRG